MFTPAANESTSSSNRLFDTKVRRTDVARALPVNLRQRKCSWANRHSRSVPRADFPGVSKRFPGNQRVKLIQPSRASLRLGSTHQSSGLLIGLTRVASLPRRPILRSLRFDVQAVSIFPRSSLSRRVDLGCQTARSKGDLSLKDTAEFVSGPPARRGWRVDNQFRRD